MFDEADKEAEIEITEEMLEAGAEAIRQYHAEYDLAYTDCEELAASVFVSMDGIKHVK
ncbi:MAG: hypothetical protein NPIRA05_22400 [Nitrospirales bacterium]|nr:MAG: hypothetical protein NPIRA05_22400 [Nitrospirales bacterium]